MSTPIEEHYVKDPTDVLQSPERLRTDIQGAKSPEEALDLLADYFSRKTKRELRDVAVVLRERLVEWGR